MLHINQLILNAKKTKPTFVAAIAQRNKIFANWGRMININYENLANLVQNLGILKAFQTLLK